MRIEDRILFNDNGIPCIYMPVGKPEDGGSCAFMTDKCYQNCPSCGVVTPHEERVLKYFLESSSEDIADRMLLELNEYFGKNIISWNSWGDCLPELTGKYIEVMYILNRSRIIQNGFTRNKELWKMAPKLDDLRIALTVDDMDEAKKMSYSGVVCCPDVDNGQARIFIGGELKSRCSGWFCLEVKSGRTLESDCLMCYVNQTCCFSKLQMSNV